MAKAEKEVTKAKKEAKKSKPEEGKEKEAPKGMTQKEADDIAASYIPDVDKFEKKIVDGEVLSVSKYDVVFVTSDRNVFFKWNEGSARNHAKRKGIKLFKVEM